jgi:regulator of protease activity HflC (stomatin/prohibitin superfamily)
VHTDQIEAKVAQDATKGDGKTTGISDQGLEIVQIGFSRMAFPPANAVPVYYRMAAERQAEAQKTLSEGEADANATRARGQTEAITIRSEGVKIAEEIRGKGEAEALAKLQEVQQSKEAREFYQKWKALEFVRNSLTKNTYLVLSTESDWLKSLFTAPTDTGVTGIAPTVSTSSTQPSIVTPGTSIIPGMEKSR